MPLLHLEVVNYHLITRSHAWWSLRKKRGTATYELVYAKELSEEEVQEYNANRPTEDDTEIELILDFYNRLLYRLEYMMKVGQEKGYDLISFMGP